MNKTSDALYHTVINIDFFRNDTSLIQWYLQIDMLDVCRSLESTLALLKSDTRVGPFTKSNITRVVVEYLSVLY